jgi:hypothetical protein
MHAAERHVDAYILWKNEVDRICERQCRPVDWIAARPDVLAKPEGQSGRGALEDRRRRGRDSVVHDHPTGFGHDDLLDNAVDVEDLCNVADDHAPGTRPDLILGLEVGVLEAEPDVVSRQSGDTQPHVMIQPKQIGQREVAGVASKPDDLKALRHPVSLVGTCDFKRDAPRLEGERGAQFGVAKFYVAAMDDAGHGPVLVPRVVPRKTADEGGAVRPTPAAHRKQTLFSTRSAVSTLDQLHLERIVLGVPVQTIERQWRQLSASVIG